MNRAERVAIAKRILDFNARDVDEMGDESWETDIGRFTDQARFERVGGLVAEQLVDTRVFTE